MADQNRFGQFSIPDQWVRDEFKLLAEVFAEIKFFPMRCDVQLDSMRWVYAGYSPYFTPIDSGQISPQYDIIIHQTPEGDLDHVEVKKKELHHG